MKKVKKFISIILIVSILTMTGGCNKGEESDFYKEESDERFLIQDKKIIDNLYFENNENAFFYGNTINAVVNNRYDYYSIYWMLGLDNLLGIGLKEKIETRILSDIETGNICNEKNYRYNGVFDIYLRSGVEKFLGYSINNKSYIEQIDSYYSEEHAIFDEKSGRIEDQILTTNIALKACLQLNYIPTYKDELRGKMLALCGDATYFGNTVELKRDLISNGMIILDNIRILDLLDGNDSLDELEGVKGWVIKVIEEYNKYAQEQEGYNVIVIQGNKTVYDVSKYLGLNINICGVPDVKNIKEYFLRDCQLIFQYVDRQGKVNTADLSEYIEKNYTYHIYEEKPMYNMKDVYYGVSLYEKFGLKFSKEKLENFLTNYISYNELSNDDAYFIERVLEKIGCDKNTRKEFISVYGVDHFISDGNMEDNYRYIYYINEYAIEETPGSINQIIDLAKEMMTQSEILSQVYYSLRILELASVEIDNQIILGRLQDFRNENGYSSAIDSNEVSMYSLYRAQYILEKYDKEGEKNKEIKHDAYMLRAPKGGFFIFNDGDEEKLNYDINFTLQAYYYGMILV